MKDALLSPAHQLGLGEAKGRLGGGLIAAGDGFLDLADKSTHAAAASLINGGAPRRHTSGFLC